MAEVAARPKIIALALLGALSFAAPLVETLTTGKVEDFSNFDVATTVVALPLVFWWYHVDKREHDYPAGPLMNAGILVLAVVAFPIYFVRTRGWKRGAIATLLAAVFFAILLGLGALGEWIGGFFI